jgi:2-succinyl-6-hydroxy-2,4-cyclohexadiene-1-carboxylate synthase
MTGLHVERRGGGPAIVLLHGFTQTGRCWGPLGDDLARDHLVLAPDAPGHGGSADVRADLPTTARLAAEAIREALAEPQPERGPGAGGPEVGAVHGGPPVWVGYSMGGRVALHVALDHPDVVGGLVLIGAHPGIEDAAERAERRASDRRLADDLRRDGVDAFLDRWLALPLFAGLPSWARFDDERRRNTAEGLAASLELTGTGTQAPLWDRLPGLAGGPRPIPVLAVAGAEDAKYSAVAERVARRIGPSAVARTIPGAGHAAHLERPAAFTALLRGWLHGQHRS